jgi:hypothetical protein
MGNPPTVAERSRHLRVRATGGERGGAAEGLASFERERFGDML